MRRLILSVLSVLLLLPVAAADLENALRVVPVSGEPVVLLFKQKPSVQFNGLALTVSGINPNFSQSYTIDGIDRFEFVKQTVALSGPSASITDITLSREGSMLTVGNLPEDSTLALYSVGGNMLVSAKATGEYRIDLSALAPGIYILKVNHNSIKISI